MPEHEDQTDCEKLLSAIQALSDVIEALSEKISTGLDDAELLAIIKTLAKALLNLTQIYEKHCEPDNGNGNGNGNGDD